MTIDRCTHSPNVESSRIWKRKNDSQSARETHRTPHSGKSPRFLMSSQTSSVSAHCMTHSSPWSWIFGGSPKNHYLFGAQGRKVLLFRLLDLASHVFLPKNSIRFAMGSCVSFQRRLRKPAHGCHLSRNFWNELIRFSLRTFSRCSNLRTVLPVRGGQSTQIVKIICEL